MSKSRSSFLAACLVMMLSGCATAIKDLSPPARLDNTYTVFVARSGWHAGIIVPRNEIASAVWPEQLELPPTEYAEVGWGSKDIYMASRVTPAIALRAIVWPTKSVLHVACFNGPPEQVLAGADLVAVHLPETGFTQLCRYISDSYARDQFGEPVGLGPGLYGESRFYLACGKYFFPKTCNAWTARALRAAGCPIRPAATSQGVLFQARRFGEMRCAPASSN
jgi:uncharacterized protein (TIGR02117 family)